MFISDLIPPCHCTSMSFTPSRASCRFVVYTMLDHVNKLDSITTSNDVDVVLQTDVRSISVSHWGSDLGLMVLKGLSKLYTSLVWESTVLLAFCSEDILPSDCDFGKADLEKLLPKDGGKTLTAASSSSVATKTSKSIDVLKRSTGELGSNGVSAAMQSLTTSENSITAMEVEDPITGEGA